MTTPTTLDSPRCRSPCRRTSFGENPGLRVRGYTDQHRRIGVGTHCIRTYRSESGCGYQRALDLVGFPATTAHRGTCRHLAGLASRFDAVGLRSAGFLGHTTTVEGRRHGGGPATQLTTTAQLPLGAGGAPVFSPDGARIAFSAPPSTALPPDRHASWWRSASTTRSTDPVSGGSVRAHLFEFDLAAGSLRQLTDGDWDASHPAYSPDGTELAFTAAMDGDADLTRASSAWTVSLTDLASAPRMLGGHARGIAGPLAWTPAGDAVVAVGWHTPIIHNNELLVLHRDQRVEDRSLTSGLDRNVMPGGTGYPGGAPSFTADGDIVFCIRNHGSTELHKVDFGSGSVSPLLTGEQTVVSGLALTSGRAVVALATATSFGEVAVIDLETRAVETVTELNTELTTSVAFPVASERWFDISDGTRVQGWILRDPNVTGAGPLVLDVHGGPHNAWTGTPTPMHAYHAELVALGYTVLMINPRGSDGYGNDFFDGVRDGWGVRRIVPTCSNQSKPLSPRGGWPIRSNWCSRATATADS